MAAIKEKRNADMTLKDEDRLYRIYEWIRPLEAYKRNQVKAELKRALGIGNSTYYEWMSRRKSCKDTIPISAAETIVSIIKQYRPGSPEVSLDCFVRK